MKLTELIKQLNEIYESQGDKDVYVYDYDEENFGKLKSVNFVDEVEADDLYNGNYGVEVGAQFVELQLYNPRNYKM